MDLSFPLNGPKGKNHVGQTSLTINDSEKNRHFLET